MYLYSLQEPGSPSYGPHKKERIRNNLNLILTIRGFDQAYIPNKLDLNQLVMSPKRFIVIRNNEEQPTFEETYRIVEWLGIEFREIFNVQY